MNLNYKEILFTFDLLGKKPQLRIFNYNSYKTLFSSLTSIIILLICIAFSIYSIVIYSKFENPSVTYSKDNDKITPRTILIKDTLLMFKFVETSSINVNINIQDTFFDPIHVTAYYNGSVNQEKLITEKCELDKNIDIKYKSLIEEMEKGGNSINEFYCISHIHGNLSLNYIPEIGYSSIYLYLTIKKNGKYIPEKLQSIIISENDIIDHNNKENPVLQSYIHQFTPSFSSNEYTKINYNFQYIKYESDNGLIFKTSNISDAKSFSDINYYKYTNKYNFTDNSQNSNEIRIGEILFEINKLFFDHYKRTYPKIQSLITEIMAVINLLLGIGEQFFNILLSKKMSKDIVKILLNKNNNEIHRQQIINQKNEINNDLINEMEGNHKTTSEIEIHKNFQVKIDTQEGLEKISQKTKIINKEKINKEKINAKIIKNLNYWNIIKSYLCFKDKKSRLINACHNLIFNDLCIERILKRLYNLENILEKIDFNILNKDKNNHNFKGHINNKFKEINEYINQINNEIEN